MCSHPLRHDAGDEIVLEAHGTRNPLRAGAGLHVELGIVEVAGQRGSVLIDLPAFHGEAQVPESSLYSPTRFAISGATDNRAEDQ